MPLRGTQNAPKFDGKSSVQLPRYLEDIEFLGMSANLFEEEQIHAAIQYVNLNEAEVWQTLPETTTVPANWVNFVAAVKDLYLGCEGDDQYCRADLQYLVQEYCTKPMQSQQNLGEYRRKFLKVASLLIATRKLSDTERDDLFLRGFPPEVEGKLRHHLLIVKSDLHPDNPYPFADTNNAAKFLLTGSAFWSSFQSPLPTPATSAPPRQPYHQAYQPPQQTYQPSTHQSPGSQLPASQVKQKLSATTQNQFRNGNCDFCGGPGHFTRSCVVVGEYIRAGKILCGQDRHLYFVDRSQIPRIPRLQFIKECVDRIEAERTGVATMSTSSTTTSANFVRDPSL
jgi:hypothetical protein